MGDSAGLLAGEGDNEQAVCMRDCGEWVAQVYAEGMTRRGAPRTDVVVTGRRGGCAGRTRSSAAMGGSAADAPPPTRTTTAIGLAPA